MVFQNGFQGNVYPIKKRRSESPPILQEEIRIGETDTSHSHLWTTLRLIIRPATPQYPKAMLQLSLGSSAKNYGWCRLNQGDIAELITFLSEHVDKIEEVYREEIRKSVLIQEQIKQFDQVRMQAENLGIFSDQQGQGQDINLEQITAAIRALQQQNTPVSTGQDIPNPTNEEGDFPERVPDKNPQPQGNTETLDKDGKSKGKGKR